MRIYTITKRMRSVQSDIFRSMLTRRDFAFKIAQLRDARPSRKPSLCADLCEMFAALGIECKPGMDADYYEALAEQSEIADFRDIETHILEIMFSCFEVYPTPAEYMQRIVDRLSDPADGWQGDSLRLRILKQFIRYGNSMVYPNATGKVHIYGGEGYLKKYAKTRTGKTAKTAEDILQALDEQVFDVLETAAKAQKKQDGTYGLLKTADDLARGVFKSGGATRRDLYMFAIVFGMTCSGVEDATDMEKNLFEDYYTNNLMRFVTETCGEPGSFEMDPSGQGVNYKNFAEMVYMYFIASDYTPAEKLRRASEMIERLRQAGQKPTETDDTSTKFYTALFTDELLQMPEAAFERFIAENYDCEVEFEDIDQSGKPYTGRRGVLQVRTAQDTAFSIHSAHPIRCFRRYDSKKIWRHFSRRLRSITARMPMEIPLAPSISGRRNPRWKHLTMSVQRSMRTRLSDRNITSSEYCTRSNRW